MKLGITLQGYKRIAKTITQGIWDDPAIVETPYYSYEPGMSIEEITRKWVEENAKISDYDMPIMLSVESLLPYREYEWTRDEARLDPEEWDELVESMKGGWQEGSWLTLNVGKNGGVYLGEGNHRLAIAYEIGMEELPVYIWYRTEVHPSQQLSQEEIDQENAREVI